MDREQLSWGYRALSMYDRGPVGKPFAETGDFKIATFKLHARIDPLFPYINRIAERAALYREPSLIRFVLKGRLCALYPQWGLASPFSDRAEAEDFLDTLVTFLLDIHDRRGEIIPRHKLFRRGSALEILKLLPMTNCGKCGFSTCMAFAANLGQQESDPGQCPHMAVPMAEQAVYPVYDEKGNLTSTVTIDIDTSAMGNDLKENRNAVQNLEQKLSELSAETEATPPDAACSLPSPLTQRELQVLRMIANGETNMEISRTLEISPHTVKSHVIHIFNKLGVNDRTQAAVWAARRNLV